MKHAVNDPKTHNTMKHAVNDPKFPYTYQGLPENYIELAKIWGWDKHNLSHILAEAVKYQDFHHWQISNRLWEYLQQKYHITKGKWEGHQFIYNNQEGYITVVEGNYGKTLGLLVEPETLEQEFFIELGGNKPHSIPKRGINTFLDPNWGGSFNKERLSLASIWIMG